MRRGVAYSARLHFIDFNKEMTKKNPRILPLWSKIEGIALWLNTDLCQWGGMSSLVFLKHCNGPLTPPLAIEDADRKNTQIVALYGVALLSTISLLIKKDEFRENSNIKNLGLILGLFIEFAFSSGSNFCDDSDEGEGNDNWTKRVLQLAEKHGVKIAGSWGIEKRIKNLKDEMDTDDEASVDETEGSNGSISPKDLTDLGLAIEGKDEEDWEDEDDEDEVKIRSWKTWNWAKEVS